MLEERPSGSFKPCVQCHQIPELLTERHDVGRSGTAAIINKFSQTPKKAALRKKAVGEAVIRDRSLCRKLLTDFHAKGKTTALA
jgi:hypothetical protein